MVRMNYNSSGAQRLGTLAASVAAMLVLTAAHPGAHEQTPKPVAAAATVDNVAETPVGAVTAFHAALGRGDTVAVLALLTEDVRIFESGGVERNRAEYAAHHLKADAAFSAAVRRTLVDQSSDEDGDTAWVMTVEAVEGTYRARKIESRSVETMVLRRLNGYWRIAHIHWSSADK